jgi:sterol-4alpha-carboxylate 3-dehydrogenase (decarboxylating)
VRDGSHVLNTCCCCPRVIFFAAAAAAAAAAAVVFDGSDLVGVDESLPYTTRPMDYYTQTKIAGEELVLAANSQQLAVVALRPSGIFGEGDTVMVPTFVKQAKAGKMKYIIGNGQNVWDFTYVGNVAQAHVLVSVLCVGGGDGSVCLWGGGRAWKNCGE